MPKTRIELPFVRNVWYSDAPGGDPRNVSVVDALPLDVETVPERQHPYDAMMARDGVPPCALIVHDGKVYEGYRRFLDGKTVKELFEAMDLDIGSRHRAFSSEFLEGKTLMSPGRRSQEAELNDLQGRIVISSGKVYSAGIAPMATLSIENDRINVSTVRPTGQLEWRSPSWMRFPLDRTADALTLAETLSPLFAEGVDADHASLSSWKACTDAFRSLRFAQGGDGLREERLEAFARDILGLVTPALGGIGSELVRTFVDLRDMLEDPCDLQEPLETLAQGLRAMTVTKKANRGIWKARIAGTCLAARLEGWEPHPAIHPAP